MYDTCGSLYQVLEWKGTGGGTRNYVLVYASRKNLLSPASFSYSRNYSQYHSCIISLVAVRPLLLPEVLLYWHPCPMAVLFLELAVLVGEHIHTHRGRLPFLIGNKDDFSSFRLRLFNEERATQLGRYYWNLPSCVL